MERASIAVLAVYGIGQLLEGYVLIPWLVGDRIGLHPLAVIFALLAFGQLFGFVGVLLALPAVRGDCSSACAVCAPRTLHLVLSVASIPTRMDQLVLALATPGIADPRQFPSPVAMPGARSRPGGARRRHEGERDRGWVLWAPPWRGQDASAARDGGSRQWRATGLHICAKAPSSLSGRSSRAFGASVFWLTTWTGRMPMRRAGCSRYTTR